MRRVLITLLSLLLLSACGDTPADRELQKMHDSFGRYIEEVHISRRPTLAATEFALDLTNYTLSGILETEFHAVLQGRGRYDISNPRDPIIEQNLSLDAATLDVKTKKPTTDALKASASVRIAKKRLGVNISNVLLSASNYLPQPFTLPAELKNRWYGETFTELNTRLSERAKLTSEPPRTIEDMLESAFGESGVSTAENMRLWNSLELWNGTDMRTKGDITEIDVVSDKKKIVASFRAIADYLRRTGGESWTNAEKNPELANEMQELTDPQSETMKTLPQVRGTMSVDTQTSTLRGFSGSVFSATGAKLATLSLSVSAAHDISFTMNNLDHPEAPLVFLKKGDKVSLFVGADAVLEGTVSRSKVAFVLTDPRSKAATLKAEMAVKSIAKDAIVLGPSTFDFPGKGTLALASLSLTQKEGILDLALKGSWNVDGKQGVLFSLTFGRRPAGAFNLDLPVLAPFEQLQPDLSAAFMGMASAMNPSPLDR